MRARQSSTGSEMSRQGRTPGAHQVGWSCRLWAGFHPTFAPPESSKPTACFDEARDLLTRRRVLAQAEGVEFLVNHHGGKESDSLSLERTRETLASEMDDLIARASESRDLGSRTTSSGSRVDEPDPLQVALPRLANGVESVLQRMTTQRRSGWRRLNVERRVTCTGARRSDRCAPLAMPGARPRSARPRREPPAPPRKPSDLAR